MSIYCALINTLSAHVLHINLNMIVYTPFDLLKVLQKIHGTSNVLSSICSA